MKLKNFCFAVAVSALTLPAYSSSKANHLVITEVGSSGGIWGSGGHVSSEFTEIYNPTNAEIDLTNYYLTDWSKYWDLPYVTQYDPTNFPKEGAADWIVRFPANTKIPAGGVIVITAHGQSFVDAYFAGDINAFLNQPGSPKLFEHSDTRADIGNMIDLNLDSIADPNLTSQGHTDGGENVFLFYWDGISDLVQDVDIVMWAAAGADLGTDNGYAPKGPFTPSDGPDPGGDLTAYFTDNGSDTNLAVRNGSAATTRQSYRRSLFEIGEIQSGGNGYTGSDETSEQNNISWVVSTDVAEATPGILPASVLAADQAPIIWATRATTNPNSGAPVTINAQIMDDGTISSAKLYWRKTGGTTATINMTNAGGDNWTANIPAQPNGTGVYWYVEATDNTANTRSEADYRYTGSDFYAHYYVVLDAPLSGSDLMFTELYFDNEGTDNAKYSEWVEIYNARNTPIDLSHLLFYYNSASFEFPADTIIEAKGRIIIAAEGKLFRWHDYPRYDATPVIDLDQDGTSYFGNTAGTFSLASPNDAPAPGQESSIIGIAFESVEYDVAADNVLGWTAGITGGVYTFELKGYETGSVDNNIGNNWYKSEQPGGSPGKPNSVDNAAPVVITGGQRDLEYPGFNVPINITCASATAANATLFYNTDGTATYLSKPMTKAGTDFSASVGPFTAQTRVKYFIKATDAAGNVGYQPHAFPYGFVVSDAFPTGADVVINEIMYNPRGTDNYSGVEFVELFNTTTQPIDVSWWEIGRAAGDYWTRVLPEGTTIGPRDFLVVAGRTWLMEREYPGIDTSRIVDLQWWDARRMNTNTPPTQESNSIYANSGARAVVLVHANSRGWGNNDPFHVSGTPAGSTPIDLAPYEVNQNGWPASQDGYSIELINPTMDNTVGANWLKSAAQYGSPLQQNGVTSSVSDWSIY